MMVALYLSAIVAANLMVAAFAGVTIVNAFLFIGLDLTSRDSLHEAWKGKGLWWKMALLIGVGSLLSWLLNRGAGQIALASFVAFALSGVVDTLIYRALERSEWRVRVNGSNVGSALVDSFVFPTLAFGVILPWIVLGQFAAKVLGGLLWSLVLSGNRNYHR